MKENSDAGLSPCDSKPMTVKAGLLALLGDDHADGLRIGGLLAEELADRFGTPLYVYDADGFRQALAAVQSALGARVKVLFALKANPNAAVARTLRLAGAGCEVASAGEILIAHKAGFAGKQIHFAGPGKRAEDLLLAFKHGVATLNIESEAEYALICTLAEQAGVRPGVAIRVNPRQGMGGSRMHMGGASKKFGVDSERVRDLAQRIIDDDVCELQGLHVYAGTQSFHADDWLANAAALCAFASELAVQLPAIAIRSLNFGGGFGVPMFEGDNALDLARLGAGLQALIAADGRADCEYHVELGRYLTANAGVYLSRVLYTKESGGRQHAIVDGGMHQHAAAVGLGTVIRRPYPMLWCHAPHQQGGPEVSIGGPLCTPVDEFAAGLSMPAPRAGDVLAILASGAYGLSFSNVMFLSHPTPGEVLVDGGRAALVRRPGRPDDVLRDQQLLDEQGGRADVGTV